MPSEQFVNDIFDTTEIASTSVGDYLPILRQASGERLLRKIKTTAWSASLTFSVSQITATGTPDNTTVLYGDGRWAVPTVSLTGLLNDRGNFDASGNAFPSSGGSGSAGAILKGNLWTISVAGTLGGHAVTAGDVVRALADTPGQTDANWAITENNLGYVAENSANKVTAFSTPTDVQYPSAKLVSDQLALKANLLSPSFTTPTLGVASAISLALTGTAGAGFGEFPTQSSPPTAPATGYREYADSTGRRSWIRASDGFTRTWDATLTGNRVYGLFDASDTLVGLTVAQALTNKTINGNTFTPGTYTLTGTAAKTLNFTDNVTLASDGTGTRTLNIGAGGTLGSNAFTSTAYATLVNNTFTRGQTITQGTANESILLSTGYSLTGSSASSLVDLAGTWNTSGVPTLIKANVTNTASGGGSLLLDLQINGVSQFSVGKNAAVTTLQDFNAGAARYIGFTGRSEISSPSDGVLLLSDNAVSTFARLQLGGTNNTYPAIKRSAATLAFRLADDSADAAISAAGGTFGGAVSAASGFSYPNSGNGAATFSNGVYLSSTQQISWSSSATAVTPLDTVMYRSSAGVTGFGTTTNNALGSWLATNGTLSGSLSLAAGGSASFVKSGGALFDHYADVSTTHTDGTEDDLYSDSVPASTLNTNGHKLRLVTYVNFVSSATASRRLKAYFAGTLIFDSGSLTLSLGGDFSIEALVIRESSTVVRVTTTVTSTSASSVPYVTYTRITGLTLTNANILKTTGIASGTGALSGDVTAKMGTVEFLPAQ